MNSLFKAASVFALVGMVGLSSHSALAATADGSIGTNSTGTSDVTVTIAENFLITGMSAFAFGTRNIGDGNADTNDDICIYHNGDGSYKVNITDDSTGGTGAGFNVENAGNTETISYAVSFNDVSGTGGSIAVVDGANTVAQSGADTASQSCAGGDTANIQVVITNANMNAAVAGAYDSELTIVVDAD